MIFSPHLGTAASLTYTEATVRSRNAVYVLGSGAGDTRIVELVIDSDDVGLRGRREFALDARDASTAAAAQDAGARLGDIVTIDLPDLGLRFDRRVEAVRLRADLGEPLQICLPTPWEHLVRRRYASGPATMFVRHQVQDFATWKQAYEAGSSEAAILPTALPFRDWGAATPLAVFFDWRLPVLP